MVKLQRPHGSPGPELTMVSVDPSPVGSSPVDRPRPDKWKEEISMVLKVKGHLVPHVLSKCQLVQAPCDQVLLTEETRHTDRRDLKALDGQRSMVKGQRPKATWLLAV